MADATFAVRLRWARQRAGLTQVQLAQRAGVGTVTVSTWERGKAGAIRTITLSNVASVLQVSASWLASGDARD